MAGSPDDHDRPVLQHSDHDAMQELMLTTKDERRDRSKRKVPPPWLPDLPRPTGRQIAAVRKAAGMTQTETAEVMMVAGKAFVSDIEHGRRDITYLQWWRFLLVTGQHPRLKLVEREPKD